MVTLREVLIFLAGAEFFHTLSHIMLPFFIALPIQVYGFTFTSTYNFWAILVNGLITIALLWWAHKAKKEA